MPIRKYKENKFHVTLGNGLGNTRVEPEKIALQLKLKIITKKQINKTRKIALGGIGGILALTGEGISIPVELAKHSTISFQHGESFLSDTNT